MNMKQMELHINGYKIYMGGLSEIGKYKKVNQDAFLIGGDETKELAYIIVADGLGSCVNSAQGAKRVTNIIEKWLLEKLPKYAFISDNVANILAKRLVEEWNASYEFDEIFTYDTTVHMAVLYKSSLLVGGIGDGMALVSYDDLVCKEQIEDKELFGNVTNSMCSMNVKELLDFEVIPTTEFNNQAVLILSTDGIADDLIPEKKLTLPAYFFEVLSKHGIETMQAELKEWIEGWETENHSDDKTICYLVVEKEAV